MTEQNVPIVNPMELGIAFALFRAAVLDETKEGSIQPLTDEYIDYCLTDSPQLERGFGVLRIHFNSADVDNPTIKRVRAFIQLLRKQASKSYGEWLEFRDKYNRFIPIIHAIAWCPMAESEVFSLRVFMKIARGAPQVPPQPSTRTPIC